VGEETLEDAEVAGAVVVEVVEEAAEGEGEVAENPTANLVLPVVLIMPDLMNSKLSVSVQLLRNKTLTVKRDSDSSEASENEKEEVEEDVMSVETDDDEEETEQTSRPYMALLQSFQESSTHKAKRRKLDHSVQGEGDDDAEEESGDEDERKEAPDADLVEQEEEEEEEEVLQAGEGDEDSEDEGETLDPFDLHFAHPNEASTAKAVNAAKNDEWTTGRKLMGPLRATVQSAGSDSTLSTQDLKNIKLKEKLQETFSKTAAGLNEAQKHIASLMFNYQDVLYCDRNVDNAETLRRLVCSHALNHIFK
jgi:U3 small nucleolar RNA-associated protein 25